MGKLYSIIVEGMTEGKCGDESQELILWTKWHKRCEKKNLKIKRTQENHKKIILLWTSIYGLMTKKKKSEFFIIFYDSLIYYKNYNNVVVKLIKLFFSIYLN